MHQSSKKCHRRVLAEVFECEGTFSSIIAVHHCLPSGLQIAQCSSLCVLLHHLSSLLDVSSGWLPLVCSELLSMSWPDMSEDETICKQRLKLVGELLQECLPPAQKFEQLAILMEKFELDDWKLTETRWYAKQAVSKPEERWVGFGKTNVNGLPGLAVVGNLAAPGAASSAAQAALLSSGGSALVAPPQAASITLNSASVAMVEANKQQALARAALAQAAMQEQLQRDLAQLG